MILCCCTDSIRGDMHYTVAWSTAPHFQAWVLVHSHVFSSFITAVVLQLISFPSIRGEIDNSTVITLPTVVVYVVVVSFSAPCCLASSYLFLVHNFSFVFFLFFLLLS